MNFLKLLIITILCIQPVLSQTVGLVLSGGGAKGAAHIGLLRSLEENNIPIDYITGTSMGAVIGGLYAAGYTVEEIEDMVTDESFATIVSGNLSIQDLPFYNSEENDPSLLSVDLRIDSLYSPNLKFGITNDLLINYSLMEKLAPASIQANCDFDSLYIPFRAMASEVLTETSVVLKEGKLDHAIRASMAIPFVFRPIKFNNQYLFDGGLYNNFPGDVMISEFNPDIIIGSNVTNTVAEKYPENDESLRNTNDIFLFIKKVDPSILREKDIYIQPEVLDFGTNEFDKIYEIIDSGYVEAQRNMDLIKSKIARRTYPKDRFVKRYAFKKKIKPLVASEINVLGITEKQNQYIEKLLRNNKQRLNAHQLKVAYLKLAGDKYFQNIYPELIYNPVTEKYMLNLEANPSKTIEINLGGFLTSRGINTAFASAEYNHLNRFLSKYYINAYSGDFYSSAKAKLKLSIPSSIQYSLIGEYGFNRFDYLNSRELHFESSRPINLITRDHHVRLKGIVPFEGHKRIEIAQTLFHTRSQFSERNNFGIQLKPDIVDTEGSKSTISLIENTLNDKVYPSNGRKLTLATSLIGANYDYEPGSEDTFVKDIHQKQWYTEVFADYEEYFKLSPKIQYGLKFQALYSNQKTLQGYYSTIVNAPSYSPLVDTRSFFIKHFRSYKFVGLGMVGVYELYPNISARLEGHYFKPFEVFQKLDDGDISVEKDLSDTKFGYHVLSANLVYKSKIGPLSLSFNYYNNAETDYGVFLHFGYVLFNKRPMEY